MTKITSAISHTFHWSCLSTTPTQYSKVDDLADVSVLAKVLQVGDKHEVKPGLSKQDITVADTTASLHKVDSVAE